MKTTIWLAILAGALGIVGCRDKNPPEMNDLHELRSLSPERLQALNNRTIYFGHMSVGDNILDGIRAIASREPSLKVRITEKADAAGGLYEFRIPPNGDPEGKLRSYVATLHREPPPVNAVLMMKFCYDEMERETDVAQLFAQYRSTIEELRGRYPGRTIVHITMPLTTVDSGPEYFLRKTLHRYSRRDLNRKRNQLNEALRRHFAAKDPIFDLAEIESTRADGSRYTVPVEGGSVFALAPEWTSDGSHLNEAGQVFVAQRFLAFLSSLPN